MKIVNSEKDENFIREMNLDFYIGYPLASYDYEKAFIFCKFASLWMFWDDFEVEKYDRNSSLRDFSKYFTRLDIYDKKMLCRYDGVFNNPRVTLQDLKYEKDPICLAWMDVFDDMKRNRSEEF